MFLAFDKVLIRLIPIIQNNLAEYGLTLEYLFEGACDMPESILEVINLAKIHI